MILACLSFLHRLTVIVFLQRLDELANNCTVSCLLVYCTICATYLCFYKA